MYRNKTYKYGDYIEVIKYYPTRRCAGGSREGRYRPTTEAMEKHNQRMKEKKVQRIMLANFAAGDWHITLSYEQNKRPDTVEEAKERAQKFLRKLKRRYKAAGNELKYIYVTERGKKGACHHHLIINDIQGTKNMICELWKEGHWNFTPLYEDGEFLKLAQYIVKKETKEGGTSYSRSRNMIVPEAKVKNIYSLRWAAEPRPVKGYEIMEHTIFDGENPVNGTPYQTYMMKKTERKKREKRGKSG